MSIQQVGITAFFDTRQFNSGVRQYQSGLRDATQATQVFNTQINNVNMSQFNSSVSSTSGGLSSLGAIAGGAALAGIAALAAAVTGLVVGMVDAVGVAADFEQGIANLASASGKSIEDIGELRDLALDLSVNPELTVSATEAAGALELLARNGVSADDILAGVGEQTIALANATGTDFSTAADIATDAMALFGVEANEFSRVADSMTAATLNSKFSMDDLALAYAQGAPVASAYGMSLEQFNAIMTETASSFGGGSQAGTAFKVAMNRLQSPTEKSAAAMKALGINLFNTDGTARDIMEVWEQLNSIQGKVVSSTVEVGGRTDEQSKALERYENRLNSINAQLFDYETGVKGVGQSSEDTAKQIKELENEKLELTSSINGLKSIQGEFVTTERILTEEEISKHLTDIFGSRGKNFALAAMKVTTAELKEMTKVMGEEGTSAQAAATRTQTFRGAIERMKSSFQFVQIALTSQFLDPLSAVLDKGITPLIRALPALAGVAGAAFSRMFAGFGTGIDLSFLDGIKQAFTGFEQAGLGGFLNQLGFGFEGLKFGFDLEKAIEAGNYDKAVDMLAEKLGGLDWGIVTSLISGKLSTAFASIGELNAGFLGGIATGIVGEFLGIETTISDVFNNVTTAIGNFFAYVSEQVTAFQTKASFNFLTGLGFSIDTTKQILDIQTAIMGFFTTIQTAVTAFQTGGVGGLVEFLGLTEFVENVTLAGPVIGLILEPALLDLQTGFLGFLTALSPLTTKFSELFATIQENSPGLIKLGAIIGVTLVGAVSVLGSYVGALLPIVGTLLASAFELSIIWAQNLVTVLSALGEGLLAIAEGDLPGFIDAFTKAGTAIVSNFTAPLQTDLGVKFTNAISTTIADGLAEAASYKSAWAKSGIEIISSIISGIVALRAKIIKTITGVIDDMYQAAWDLASDLFERLGRGIMDFIGQSILDNIGAVQGALGDAMQAAIDAALGSIGLGGGGVGSSSAFSGSSSRAAIGKQSNQPNGVMFPSNIGMGNNITNVYNLNVSNSLPGDTIRNDFELMRALA